MTGPGSAAGTAPCYGAEDRPRPSPYRRKRLRASDVERCRRPLEPAGGSAAPVGHRCHCVGDGGDQDSRQPDQGQLCRI
jgi:hypothetical protein